MALCSIRNRNDILIAQAPTSIDHITALTLEKELRELVFHQPKAVLLDLSTTEYLSSSGIRILLATAKTAKLSSIAFGLFSLSPFVNHIICLSGMDRLLPIFDTEDTAVKVLMGN